MGNALLYYQNYQLANFVQSNQFFYRGLVAHPICNQCYFCGKERFTQEEVAILSDPALTMDKFMELNIGYIRMMNCNECWTQDRSALAGIVYDMHGLWMNEESATLHTKFPKYFR